MSKNETPTKVIVSCRFSYLHCWEPEAINGGEPKYSVSAIIPKSDKETIKKIQAAVEAAKQESLSKWGGKIPPNLKLPLRDGDIDRPEDEAYKGCYFFNANSRQAPQVVDKQVQPILDQTEVYSGCYGRISVNFYGYRDRFFLPDKRNRNIIYSYKPRDGAEEAIYNLISDICISMKAEDYLSMPECLYHRVEVRMDEKEEKLYRQMEKDMLLPFEDGDVDAVNAAALSGKLLQMANGAVYDENHKVRHIHDKKLDALEDLIEAANGKPVLVAYWYQHDLDRIVERFKAVPLKAAGDIRKWKEGKIPVAAIHPASAGHGLNIQDGGHILIWFGLTWSLELYMQCNARLWRQGQRETVMIYHIINKGTLDEDAMRSLEQKDCGQSAIIDAVKARIGGVNGASRKDD